MKKIISVLLACVLLLAVACAAAETTDAVTTASVANYYGALTGDELMNAGLVLSDSCSGEEKSPDGDYVSRLYLIRAKE